MTKKSTKSKLSKYRAILKDFKPKNQTLHVILAFAATYQVERLSNGQVAGYFLN